jgi:flagellar biosynthesis anti-sigma factor FlgM
MRIDGSKPGPTLDTKVGKQAQSSESKPQAQEQVVVSATLREKLESSAKEEAARAERLQALRSQIRSGSYRIDFDKLAERILQDETARWGEK